MPVSQHMLLIVRDSSLAQAFLVIAGEDNISEVSGIPSFLILKSKGRTTSYA